MCIRDSSHTHALHAQLIEQLMSDLGVVGETAFGHLHDEALRLSLIHI